MTALFSLPSGFHAAVIGGAGDIGAAISNLLCDLGATVTATAVDAAAISRSQLRPRAGLSVQKLDVTSDEAVDTFAKAHQRVDALVNCAGILARDKEYEIATFMKVLDVNLTGTFRTCMAFRPALARTKGSIVNIASMNATLALPRIPAYCASKGGVVMLTKALALSWAEEGIRVNAVAPGYIETSINEAGGRIRSTIVASPSVPLSSAGASRKMSPARWRFYACRRQATPPALSLRSTADSSPANALPRSHPVQR
jgi:NAD(P)-dependent dehydrogenase (short-subunit alcohol dehydrogenase family)